MYSIPDYYTCVFSSISGRTFWNGSVRCVAEMPPCDFKPEKYDVSHCMGYKGVQRHF